MRGAPGPTLEEGCIKPVTCFATGDAGPGSVGSTAHHRISRCRPRPHQVLLRGLGFARPEQSGVVEVPPPILSRAFQEMLLCPSDYMLRHGINCWSAGALTRHRHTEQCSKDKGVKWAMHCPELPSLGNCLRTCGKL